MNSCVLGFNGERLDPVSGTTHLGNGYRAYNPVLMRFNCPDSMSPFGAGGINPYAYCAGDPVNRADPSGHWSLGQWIGMGVGLLAGIALSMVTGGAALGVVAALAADVAGGVVIGAGSELISEAVDGQRINWGQVGIQAGIGAAAALVGFGVGKGLSKVKQLTGTPLNKLGFSKTTWGWDSIRNLNVLEKGERKSLYTFTDIHQGALRLNIVAHAGFSEERGTAVFVAKNGQYFDGTAIGELVMNNTDIGQYVCARTIMCHSADGEANSLANLFRRRTGLITTGFRGEVTTTGELSMGENDINYRKGLNSIRKRLQGYVDIFLNEADEDLQPELNNADNLFKISRDITDNYDPLTFFNGGIGRNSFHIVSGEFGGYSLRYSV